MKWITDPCQPVSHAHYKAASNRQSQLTKPQGSLGQLESIAIRLASLQQSNQPQVDQVSIAIFAGDHGITEAGISAFPQAVTAQMVSNFIQGGAAISVLAKQLGASFEVIDTGIASPLASTNGLINQSAGKGTANSLKQPAMSQQQLIIALQAGYDAIERATQQQCQLFIGGEMGIGNTTASSALYCALLDLTPAQTTGAGTGLNQEGILHKVNIVQQLIQRYQANGDDTLAWLRCVGGFEIAALVGAYIHAAQKGLPVLVDGFISSVAALCAIRLQPEVNQWLFFSHLSAEQGHQTILQSLNQQPLLALGMRLGEGSGAAMAVPLLRAACALHNQMATFEEAAIAGKND